MSSHVSSDDFHKLWNKYVAAGKSKAEFQTDLGLTDRRPLNTRRVRLEAKGYKFAEFGNSVIESVVDIKPTALDNETILKDKVRRLEQHVKSDEKALLTDHHVREAIIGLASARPSPPDWLVKTSQPSKNPGVPTLFASDWHWAEVVDPNQIGGVNDFNLTIAHRRAKALIENAIDLLTNHVVSPNYPGIVFALGGDIFSGDIHEELSSTNELELMPAFIDVYGVLIWCIQTLAERYGNVFVPCVTGNHGRNTRKPRMKGRNFTNFDWLLYNFLAKHFANSKYANQVVFNIPDGSDCLYRIYNRRYLLTHGDQFRGGDGMIGALGPIIRGDHRKRSRNNQVDQGYDTMLLGHWHQLIQLERLIVNGSLKGYDEYAYINNFGFEPPRQALWLTHPRYGITFSMPVLVDKPELSNKHTPWVAWQEKP